MYTKILSRKFELWPNNTPREKKHYKTNFLVTVQWRSPIQNLWTQF